MPPHRRAHLLLASFLSAALLALVWPGPLWIGGKIEPFVLGLPFAFAWQVLWVFLIFAALALYHRAVNGGRE